MNSSEEQEAVQKEDLEGLVKAIQQRDVLFVLYHLQQLDARSLNQEDPFSQLTPLKIALSLPPDCPRRTLIVELLLLSGASLSQEQVDARLSNGHGASSGRTSASWASGSQAEADAKMLLHDLSLEESEIWLRQQGLDVPEAYEEPPKQEKRQLHEQRSNTEHHTFEEARWVGRLPEPSPKRPRLSLPEERYFGRASPSAERSPHRRHSQPPPLPHPSSTTNSFIVDCLAPETTPSTLKRFLATFLHSSSLIQSISPTFSSGAHAFLITLNSPIDSNQILDLDDHLLDGTRLRVQLGVDGSTTIAAVLAPSALDSQYRRNRNTEDRPSSTSTSHPRRPTLRPASPPRRSLPPPARDRRPPSPSPWWEQEREELVWAPYKSCYYAYSFEDRASCSYLPPPPQGATQAELDRWAEATWVGRRAPDLPGLPPSWKPRPGAVWRGRLCSKFPPVEGLGHAPCWGRDCNFAHSVEELRKPDGSLVDLEAAAHLAKRPWKAPDRSIPALRSPNRSRRQRRDGKRQAKTSIDSHRPPRPAEAPEPEQRFGDGRDGQSKLSSAIDWLL